jgi:hypothetical protein
MPRSRHWRSRRLIGPESAAPNWSSFAHYHPASEEVAHSALRVLLAKQVLYQLSYRPFGTPVYLRRWFIHELRQAGAPGR